MEDVIVWLRNTPVPMALVTSGLACMILAIAAEMPPAEGEPRLLVPRKVVPITGTLLLLLGVPLAIEEPIEPLLLRTFLSSLP